MYSIFPRLRDEDDDYFLLKLKTNIEQKYDISMYYYYYINNT